MEEINLHLRYKNKHAAESAYKNDSKKLPFSFLKRDPTSDEIKKFENFIYLRAVGFNYFLTDLYP